MAQSTQKKRGPGRPPGSKNKPKTNHAAGPTSQEQIDEMQRKYDKDRRNVDVIWSITLVAFGLFLFFTVVMDTTGSFGRYIHDFCLGLFGFMAYALPFLVFVFAILLLAGKLQHIGWRTFIFSFLIYLNLCVLNSYRYLDENNLRISWHDMVDHYNNAVNGIEGGLLGMEIGGLLVKFFGKPGLIIIALTIMTISIFLVANTPISRLVEKWIKNREKKQILAELFEQRDRERQEELAEIAAEERRKQPTIIATMPEPVVPERRKGVRAVDLQDTIVLTPEELRELQLQGTTQQSGVLGGIKSAWRSLVGGIMGDDSDISRVPNRNVRLDDVNHQSGAYQMNSPTDIPKPFGNRVSKISRDTAEIDPVTGEAQQPQPQPAQSRVILRDKNPSEIEAEEASKDTLFGKLAKRVTGFINGEEYGAASEEDYGYPGDRRRSDQRTAASRPRAGYGLGDPDEISHSGHYGLDGHPRGGGRGLGDTYSAADSIPAVVSPVPAKDVEAEIAAKAEADMTAGAAANGKASKKTAAVSGAKAAAKTSRKTKTSGLEDVNDASHDEDDAKLAAGFAAKAEEEHYELPPISLLKRGSGPKNVMSQSEVGERAALLEKTLNDFGVDAKVLNVTQGASVTRYEVQPATGVKVARIVRLADDIALNMRAKTVRIEAPIPGKAAVGIEVENADPQPVLIRELIDSDEFKSAESKIEFVVGKDISGHNIVADMGNMPHLLVAGATGSGKSVCVNSIITSFLYKAKPSELKLIMIDPKMVELGNYNGIPHMLTPVVTDPRKAARALAIAVEEMEKRYELFAKEYVKDLRSYNDKMRNEGRYPDCKPEIIIIIDELADLMMAAPNDVENAICRLAQKARAAGMHLIVATQRPSVDVVTGLIKANIPSRIAFMTTSSIDSRTILDSTGAEKLLGKGDMLFSPVGATKPYRVQGPFISAEEIEKVIKFVKKEGGDPEYDEELKSAIDNLEQKGSSEPQDELTEEAIELIFKSGQASTSMLQRRFRIGYNRAARIIDEIEELGIIGPPDGQRARQLLITEEQYYAGLAGDDEVFEEEEEYEEPAPAEAVIEEQEPAFEEVEIAEPEEVFEEPESEEHEPIIEETEIAGVAVEKSAAETPGESFEEPKIEKEIIDEPVVEEEIAEESDDDEAFFKELEAIGSDASNELEKTRTLHVLPELPDEDVMDSSEEARPVSYNTGVNAFNSLSPEQQAKILDADYEDDY